MIDFLFTNKTLRFSAQWVAFWLISVGIHMVLIHHPDTVNYFISASFSFSYFVIVSVAAFVFFQLHKRYQWTSQNMAQLKWILVSFVVFLLVGALINKGIPLSEELKTYLIRKQFFYPLFYYNSTSIKIADITFQQILIYAFLSWVQNYTKKEQQTIFIFSLLFFALHIPLFYFFEWAAVIFVGPCILAGFIFSYFHFYDRKYGLLWSFCVHEAFYVVIGLLFRLMY